MNQPKLLWSYWHSIAKSCSSSTPIDSLTTPRVLPVTESFKYRCNYHQNTHGTKLHDPSQHLPELVSQSSTGHRCSEISSHCFQHLPCCSANKPLLIFFFLNEYRFDWQAKSPWIKSFSCIALNLSSSLRRSAFYLFYHLRLAPNTS